MPKYLCDNQSPKGRKQAGNDVEIFYASESHLIWRFSDSNLNKELAEIGFGPATQRTELIMKYSRFALAYICEEARQLVGFEVANSSETISSFESRDLLEAVI